MPPATDPPGSVPGDPFVAALLSAVVPGAGQFHNRQPRKGLVPPVAGGLAALSVAAIVGAVLYPVVRLYAIYDAYGVADRADCRADGRSGRGGSGRP